MRAQVVQLVCKSLRLLMQSPPAGSLGIITIRMRNANLHSFDNYRTLTSWIQKRRQGQTVSGN